MNQLRWLTALIAGFALAIAGAIYLGDGQPRVVWSHEFAFVTNDLCPDFPHHFRCSAIYIADADVASLSFGHQDSLALPAGTRKVLTRTTWITGLTWSPEGRQLAYLSANVAGTYPDISEPTSYDLWFISADGSSDRLIDTDVLQPRSGTPISDPRLMWATNGAVLADFRPVDFSAGLVDSFLIRDATISPDKTLTAFTAHGIDSSLICVSRGPFDTQSRQCFGDGAFGAPVWRPD